MRVTTAKNEAAVMYRHLVTVAIAVLETFNADDVVAENAREGLIRQLQLADEQYDPWTARKGGKS